MPSTGPTTIPADLVPMRVVMEDREWEVSSVAPEAKSQVTSLKPQVPNSERQVPEATDHLDALIETFPWAPSPGLVRATKAATPTSDSGFAPSTEYRWLEQYLTIERLHTLMPEADGLEIDRYELPNLLALNFVIHGLLGDGVSSSTRTDPQAKSLGEFLRARWVEVPRDLMGVGK